MKKEKRKKRSVEEKKWSGRGRSVEMARLIWCGLRLKRDI